MYSPNWLPLPVLKECPCVDVLWAPEVHSPLATRIRCSREHFLCEFVCQAGMMVVVGALSLAQLASSLQLVRFVSVAQLARVAVVCGTLPLTRLSLGCSSGQGSHIPLLTPYHYQLVGSALVGGWVSSKHPPIFLGYCGCCCHCW